MSAPQDRNFDTLLERFKSNIYGSVKGRLRLELVWEELLEFLPQLETGKPLRILDAGAGLGQFSIALAELGHEVVACDISSQMLDELQVALTSAGAHASLTVIHAPFQSLAERYPQAFDVILLHAVLEWLAEPQAGLKALQGMLKPQGWLSTLFFNRNSMVFRHLLNGNFAKIRNDKLGGWGKVLVPTHPLAPEQVLQWHADLQLQIRHYSGIRTFTDYMPREMRSRMDFGALLDMERRHARLEPFRSLGRYLHVLSQKEKGGRDGTDRDSGVAPCGLL